MKKVFGVIQIILGVLILFISSNISIMTATSGDMDFSVIQMIEDTSSSLLALSLISILTGMGFIIQGIFNLVQESNFSKKKE